MTPAVCTRGCGFPPDFLAQQSVIVFVLVAVPAAIVAGVLANWRGLAVVCLPRVLRAPFVFLLATTAMVVGLLTVSADLTGLAHVRPSVWRQALGIASVAVGLASFIRVHRLQNLFGPALSATRLDVSVRGSRV